MASALQLSKDDSVKGTATFVSMFDKFFDTLNVSSLSAGKLKRNAFKSPYRSGADFRLKVVSFYIFFSFNHFITTVVGGGVSGVSD